MTHSDFVAHLNELRKHGLSDQTYNEAMIAHSEMRYRQRNNPVMQEGEKETLKDNGSFFEPIPVEINPHEQDMVKLNQLMKDKPEGGSMFVRGDGLLPSMQWSWIATSTPRTSQDDDFGAHKTNVL